ncbi:MAG: hypothetical protein H6Q68_3262 [Firmicutes bacterium]|nr:hypothetical protein [Bacillota bacterium]
MKTKYFSNSGEETLEDLKVSVNKWIATRKNIQVIEMKTSGPSKNTPPEFFIQLSYDDKIPPRMQSTTSAPVARRRF